MSPRPRGSTPPAYFRRGEGGVYHHRSLPELSTAKVNVVSARVRSVERPSVTKKNVAVVFGSSVTMGAW